MFDYNNLYTGTKYFALLIDPDKHNDSESIINVADYAHSKNINLILVGGSLLFSDIHTTIQLIKSRTSIPVYIFPGNNFQVSSHADGILFLSLISGRNPELLIGSHVKAAPLLKQSSLSVLPTGYMLVEGGSTTAVEYISNSRPIPADKNDIAVATALAGEMLGLKAIYMDAGSGAQNTVPPDMIKAVKERITIPLIIGGGIRSGEDVSKTMKAGADMIVVGNAIEKEYEIMGNMIQMIKNMTE